MKGLAIVAVVVAALVRAPMTEAKPGDYASCVFSGTSFNPIVEGTLSFIEQPFGLGVAGFLNGLVPGVHGLLVTEFGDLSATDGSLLGSLFNPSNSTECYPSPQAAVGDWGNITADNTGFFRFPLSYTVIGPELSGPNSIIGRALVIYSSGSHCGSVGDAGDLESGNPIAMCVIGTGFPPMGGFNNATLDTPTAPTSAVAVVTGYIGTERDEHKVTGTVWFSENDDGGVDVKTEITGLPPETLHGFFVHEFGDLSGPSGSNAGPHYNPYKLPHGYPPSPNRHLGDMGNITVERDGTSAQYLSFGVMTMHGLYNILGRSVVIHAKRDNGSNPEGFAGERIAMGVIGTSDGAFPGPPADVVPKPTYIGLVLGLTLGAAVIISGVGFAYWYYARHRKRFDYNDLE